MLSQSIRRPAVAGQFYPASPEALVGTIRSYNEQDPPSRAGYERAIACMVPHAGYRYSGRVAHAVYSRLPACTSYVILGPNHFGRGQRLATLSADWLTPLGTVAGNRSFAASLIEELQPMADDPAAHAAEHSLEVQLPFLQYFVKDFTLVPIAIGAASFAELETLGQTISRLIRSGGQRTLLIASSDMNHYEPDAVTRVKDYKAIERILALDAPGLVEVLGRERISMCGDAPVIAMLAAAKDLGATKGELVQYATSADAGGDPDSVVGYAGIVID